jgi:hypothetical protein
VGGSVASTFDPKEPMNLEERLHKIVAEKDHNAYMLLLDMGPGDWREEPERFQNTFREFRETFDKCVKTIEAKFGAPSYIERKYSKHSPAWAPMGLYADWTVDDTDSIVCLFMGGDGNPEDPLMLIGGRTSAEARFNSEDPWNWKWID